jgi:hypothetical protein
MLFALVEGIKSILTMALSIMFTARLEDSERDIHTESEPHDATML